MHSSNKYRIVVLDGDHFRRDKIKYKIISNGHTAFCFEKAKICLDNLISLDPNLILLGCPTEEQAYRFLNAITLIGSSTPILIISNLTQIKQFININGALSPIVVKPEFSISDLNDLLSGATFQGHHCLKSDDYQTFIGNTSEIVQIKKRIPEFSQSSDRILIFGEPGSGRELLARSIHSYNAKDNGPFLKIFPANLNQFIYESVFAKTPVGNFFNSDVDATLEQPVQQTIFLSNIESFSIDLQGPLFHLLQMVDHQQRSRSNPVAHKYRIICSATYKLKELVDAGLFRKDLFFRLNVISCNMPPLRNRIADISLLADFIADQYCFQTQRTFIDISSKTKEIFCHYHWPGNITELKQVIQQIVLSNNEISVISNLKINALTRNHPQANPRAEDIYTLAGLKDIGNYMKDLTNVSLKGICSEFISRVEKKMMRKALSQAKGNRKIAAQLLDISYKSLLNKIKTYNLNT